MKSLQFIIICILSICSWLSVSKAATPEKREIPAFIDANRRNKDYIFNTGKYDPNAKVFFLCYIHDQYSKSALEEATRYLVPVYKKIFGRGADLIIMFTYSDRDKEEYERYKRNSYRINLPAECRHLPLRCPIVNVFHKDVRKALIKPTPSGTTYNESYPYLRAVNADGKPIAFFHQSNDTIYIHDGNYRNKRELQVTEFDTEEWMGAAILASFKDLVDKVTKEEAPTEAAAQPEAEKKQKKKPGKKDDAPAKRWKKLDI